MYANSIQHKSAFRALAASRLSRLPGISVICLSVLAGLSGCATVDPREPLPKSLSDTAEIPGIPGARFWGDEWPDYSQDLIDTLSESEVAESYSAVYGKPHNYLAISGGGPDGAFGAGLLAGWTAAGNRPEFTMVTGISTGALTAPFAFLGSDYDALLKRIYTTVETKDVIEKRGLLTAAFGDSVVDTAPLRRLISQLVDDDVIDAIGSEYRDGRGLFIGTTNLDARRSVIWNIGKIAESQHPDKAALIHDIMLASASIPVAFPPVMISVEADGESFDELHVDGGVGTQVFVYPAAVDWQKLLELLNVPEEPNVYVIRNSRIKPDYEPAERGIVPIAGRSISSLIRTQGIGDLYQIYTLAQRDGNNFHLAYIPEEFDVKPSEPFDPTYMGELYELGFEYGLSGDAWRSEPPGLVFHP